MAALGQYATPLAGIAPGVAVPCPSPLGLRRNARPEEGTARASSHSEPPARERPRSAVSGRAPLRKLEDLLTRRCSPRTRKILRCSGDAGGSRDSAETSPGPGVGSQTGEDGQDEQPVQGSVGGLNSEFPSGSLPGLGLIERNLLKRKSKLSSQAAPPAGSETGAAASASSQLAAAAPTAEAAPASTSPAAAASQASPAVAAPEPTSSSGTPEAAQGGQNRAIEAEFIDLAQGKEQTQDLAGDGDGASGEEAAARLTGSADPKAEAQAEAQAMVEAEANAARWREALGTPLSEFFQGPDGRPLPAGEGLDAAIFRRLGSRGIDEVPRWDAETRQKLLSSVLRGSGFVASDQGSVVVSARTATFHVRGELTDAPLRVQSNIQRKLELQALDLVAVLAPAEDMEGEEGSGVGTGGAEVSFVPRDILLTFTFPAPLPLVLSGVSLVLCLWLSTNVSTLAIDLPFSITTIWQSAISPLCLLLAFSTSLAARTAVAARYAVLPLLPAPLFLPSPAFGTFGPLWGYKGLLPNSRAALDISLASCLAGVLTSSAIVALGSAGSKATLIGEIPSDYVLVPTDVFGHSSGLTNLAASLASLVLLPEGSSSASGADTLASYAPTILESFSTPQLAIDPLVFGGLLALHASLLPLIPVGKQDGGVILTCVLGERTASLVSRGAVALVGIAFFFGSSYNTAILWCLLMASLVVSPSGGWPLKDGVTPLGLPREALGLLAVAVGCGFLFF